MEKTINHTRMKKRASYRRFDKFIQFLTDKESTNSCADFLRLLHETLDDCRGYRSETNAAYAEESLDFIIKERGLESIKLPKTK